MIHRRFISRLNEPEKIGTIDILILKAKYATQLASIIDSDILLEYVEYYGESVFMNGLFSFINPVDYETLLKEFPKLKNQSIMPFAKTAMGNFYLIGEVDNEEVIAFYNIQTEEYIYVDDEFNRFLDRFAGNTIYIEDEWYGHLELPALDKYGPVTIDECLTFVPALVRGGDEDIRNIQKVKLKENLEILSQAFT